MQKVVLDRIHEAHQGITKCQLRAKDRVYWTSINRDIEDLVQQCSICQETSRSHTKETLIPHELPIRPWQNVGTDLFHYGENDYLIIADYYSKFPVIRKMPLHVTSQAVIKGLKNLFSEYRVPEISNGFIERTIQTVKNTIDKAKRSNKDPEMALLTLRTTPLDSNLPSPAELLIGRKMRRTYPFTCPQRKGKSKMSMKTSRGSKIHRSSNTTEEQKTSQHSYQAKLFEFKTTSLEDEHHAEESTGTTLNIDNEQDHVSKVPEVVPQEQESTCDGTRTRCGRTIKKPNRLNL
ncbi:uncharacterized protein K02A2.6-like [Penaeus chinensis]|uniref:uncharacterized protein K02A2.6-like n=1 Tax=Penaeus chinensis TaxID=139456 RepID=UPI001FB85F3B|nr:uncharacterized protein K02A2.6-like [Penaeus chinensis]